MPRVGTDTMTALLVPLPPLEEQHRIVSKLIELEPFIAKYMLTARSRGTEADMLYELEDALDSLMFRWSMCLGRNQDYFADDACRSQINQLVQTGLDYLQQIIKGEIPQ